MAAVPEKLVVIVGQTASGKSALAMDLARRFDGEIICADARTIYKGMDIGTAKPSDAERAEIRHHLLDVVTPDQRFSALEFKNLANQVIADIQGRGKLSIMVGGTGLYVDAVLFDYKFDASTERSEANPRHAKEPGTRGEMRPNTLVVGLDVDKEVLEQRIIQRTQQMLDQQLETEVHTLSEAYGWEAPGMNAIGYREWQEPASAREQIIKNTRAYAKRQKTWFKRNKSIQWIDTPLTAVEFVTTFLGKS